MDFPVGQSHPKEQTRRKVKQIKAEDQANKQQTDMKALPVVPPGTPRCGAAGQVLSHQTDINSRGRRGRYKSRPSEQQHANARGNADRCLFGNLYGLMNRADPETGKLVAEGLFVRKRLKTAQNVYRERSEDLARQKWIHVPVAATMLSGGWH
jgi:hypothetical protein